MAAWTWLDVRPIDRTVPAATSSSGRPARTASRRLAGPAVAIGRTPDGRSRRSTTFDVAIPGRFERVAVDDRSPPDGHGELVPASTWCDPTSCRRAVRRRGRRGDDPRRRPPAALDEAAAWLDSRCRRRSRRTVVASIASSRAPPVSASVLPAGTWLAGGELHRRRAGPFEPTRSRSSVRSPHRRDTAPFVAVRGPVTARPGRPASTRSRDVAGTGREPEGGVARRLRPGPYAGGRSSLPWTGAWARHAGASGLVVGRAEPSRADPAARRSASCRPATEASRSAWKDPRPGVPGRSWTGRRACDEPRTTPSLTGPRARTRRACRSSTSPPG